MAVVNDWVLHLITNSELVVHHIILLVSTVTEPSGLAVQEFTALLSQELSALRVFSVLCYV